MLQEGIQDQSFPTQPSEWKEWAHRVCAISGTMEQPSGHFVACLARTLDSVRTRLATMPAIESRATLIARLKQIDEVSRAFSTSFLLEGVDPDLTQAADSHYLDLVVSRCQGETLKNTEFCGRVRTQFASQLAAYLKYWDAGP